MKKKKHSTNKIIFLGAIAFLLILTAGLFFITTEKSKPSTSSSESLIENLSKGVTNANWSKSQDINESAGTYGELPGQKISAEISTDNAMPFEFRDKEYLESLGFKSDPNLSADGPGSSVWGYSKNVSGVTQVVIFSSQTKPTNANQNEPAQFNCPCQTTISIFVSNLPDSDISKTNGLANPASVNCKNKGGTTVIQTNSSGGQYGLCQFPDDMACEEWAMYRGDCPVGGVKTTGFDNIEQKYCAWVGGETLAVSNANCTLPNGKVCSDIELYNGGCEE